MHSSFGRVGDLSATNLRQRVRSPWHFVRGDDHQEQAETLVTLRELARTFFFLGLTSYGGPAIVAQIRQTILRKGWLTDSDLQDSLAFCQMLPGPVAVQFGEHIGWRLRGGRGAVVALVFYMLPTFILMLVLSAVYFRIGEVPLVVAVLKGLRAATVGIIVNAIISMSRPAISHWRAIPIALASAAGFLLHVNVILVLAGAGVAGALLLPRGRVGAQTSVNGAAPAVRYRRVVLWAVVVVVAFVMLIVLSGKLGPSYPSLGTAMTKVNLLAFGGGYTAIALMYDQVVTAYKWLSRPEFLDGLALGQITPGPVIITATFIGYKVGGVIGAVFATVCVILPSAVLLVVLAPQFVRLRRIDIMGRVVRGLLAAFIGMLLFVLWQVASVGMTEPLTLVLAIGSVIALRFVSNPIWVVLGAMVVTLVFGR
ncbi:MAG: chromate efflux transporter [Candidatus Zixiibacteriota bacterium]